MERKWAVGQHLQGKAIAAACPRLGEAAAWLQGQMLIVSGKKWEAIELIQIPGLKILSLAV